MGHSILILWLQWEPNCISKYSGPYEGLGPGWQGGAAPNSKFESSSAELPRNLMLFQFASSWSELESLRYKRETDVLEKPRRKLHVPACWRIGFVVVGALQ